MIVGQIPKGSSFRGFLQHLYMNYMGNEELIQLRCLALINRSKILLLTISEQVNILLRNLTGYNTLNGQVCSFFVISSIRLFEISRKPSVIDRRFSIFILFGLRKGPPIIWSPDWFLNQRWI